MSRLAILIAAVALIGVSSVARADDAVSFDAEWNGTGESFALADYRGEVVLLNLWATWCEPCKREMPEVQALANEFEARGLNVIGVNIDRTVSDTDVATFAVDHGALFDIVRDPGNDFSDVFRSSGVPETVLIDRNGEVAFHWKGELTAGSAETRQVIADVLAGKMTDSTPAGIATVGFAAAFGAGILSLLSPCVFPLIPTYAAWIGGVSATDSSRRRSTMFRNGLLFVSGFSLIFVALGASASLIGEAIHDYRVWIARVGGIVLLAFGLHMLGVFRIALLDRTVQPGIMSRFPSGSGVGTFVVGLAFGASWTPCIGPILASILTVTAANARPGEGVALLAVYSLGLAVPFLLCTAFVERFMQRRGAVNRWIPVIERVSGVLVLGIGLLMITGLFDQLASYASRFDALV